VDARPVQVAATVIVGRGGLDIWLAAHIRHVYVVTLCFQFFPESYDLLYNKVTNTVVLHTCKFCGGGAKVSGVLCAILWGYHLCDQEDRLNLY
jgi:hypothetical protein